MLFITIVLPLSCQNHTNLIGVGGLRKLGCFQHGSVHIGLACEIVHLTKSTRPWKHICVCGRGSQQQQRFYTGVSSLWWDLESLCPGCGDPIVFSKLANLHYHTQLWVQDNGWLRWNRGRETKLRIGIKGTAKWKNLTIYSYKTRWKLY